MALAVHLDYLQKHCWKSALSVAFPRMRPYAGNYEYEPDPDLMLDDRHLSSYGRPAHLFPQDRHVHQHP